MSISALFTFALAFPLTFVLSLALTKWCGRRSFWWSWERFCGENDVGGGVVDWEYEGSARKLLEDVEVWISEVKVSLEANVNLN